MESFDIKISNFERRIIQLSRRAGTLGIVVVVTFAAVAISLFVTMGFVYPLLDTGTPEEFWIYLGASAGVPLLVAPPCTYFIARLLVLIDKSFQISERLSVTDPLTGVSNRRGFFSLASKHIHHQDSSITCMFGMVDLDNFKTLNDTHGHQFGDLALKILAEKLLSTAGDAGIVGRLGGDEFALLVVSERSELSTIERKLVDQCTNLHLANSAAADGAVVPFSASIGTTRLSIGESLDEALGRADRNLYSIKSQRKTRVSSRADLTASMQGGSGVEREKSEAMKP